jgi:hypothetical protein
MQSLRTMSLVVLSCSFSALLLACEEQKPASPAPAQASTAAATPPPTTAPSPSPEQTAEKPSGRPTSIKTELTDERRAALEKKYPSAKGFLFAKDLEEKLKANKAIKDKKAAITAFDKIAKGSWVLFSGPLVNLTDEGFDVGIVYTAQMANDPMGMSRQFFEVTLTEIEGYTKDKFKAGNVVVVLAKYTGNGKAGPGQEVVSTGDWQ